MGRILMTNKQTSVWLTIVPLFLVIVIDTMGFGVIFPVLGPMFMSKTHGVLPAHTSLLVRDVLYGVSLAAFSVTMFFGAPFLGDLSDYVGRKKVLILSLLGQALALCFSAFGVAIASIMIFILGRAFAGLMAGNNSIAQAVIIDVSPKEKKAVNLGLITLANCVGFVLGPLMSGYFSNHNIVSWFSFATPFYVSAVLAFLNAILLYFTLKPTVQNRKSGSPNLWKGLLSFSEAFKNKKVRNYSIAFCFMNLGYFMYFIYVALYLVQRFHFTQTQIGHFMAYFGLIYMVSMVLVVRLALRWMSVRTMVRMALGIISIALLLAMLPGESTQWAVPWLFGTFEGLAYVGFLTLFSNMVDDQSQGWVMGVTASITAVAFAFGSLIVGVAAAANPHLPFLIGFLAEGAAFVWMLVCCRESGTGTAREK